jgi:outer membrane protein TolC
MKKPIRLILFAGLFLWSELCLAQNKLSVGEAVAYALSHRPELRANDARVTASERNRQQAGLISNPHFFFRKEDTRGGTSILGENSQTYWEANQLIETSGKRGGRIAVANAVVGSTRLERDLQRRQISLSVRIAYWNARAMQLLADLYDEDSRFSQQLIDYHEARFREGKIAEVDLLRVRVQAQQVHAAAANAHLDAEKAKLELARQMNALDVSSWQLTDDIETLEEPWIAPTGSDPAMLRIEGQLAHQSIALAEAQTKLERANGRPDLIFTGGYKRDVEVDSPIAGVQFDLPFFNRNQGAVAAAKAETFAAEEDFQSTRNLLLAELSIARKEYTMRREQYLNVFRPLRDEAVQISNISRAAYQAGGLDLIRLLDAERARVDAELSFVKALESYHISVTKLNYAEGMDQ